MQGILGGLVMAIGYLIGQIVALLWRAADLPLLSGRSAKALIGLISIPLVAFFLWVLGCSLTWQNDIRQKMGMDPSDALQLATILPLAVATFAIAYALGRLVTSPFRLIRVYVGRAKCETPQERAELALAELIREGAFEREMLIVASPTGTGWIDPGLQDPVEYMHDGDRATVVALYSCLQSPLALILETQTGLEQATALQDAVHGDWKTLPKDARPRLYVNGLSLGA